MIDPRLQTAPTGSASRFVAALLPADWGARRATLAAAEQVDRQHGEQALDVTLAAWSRWRNAGTLPRDRWLGDLVLELQAFVSGGLEPRRARPGSIA